MLAKIPNGLSEIMGTFGDASDPDFESKYLVSFELPYILVYDQTRVGRTRCHVKAVDHFKKAFRDIEAAGLVGECFRFGGIYAKRGKRGSKHPSTHSWGIAIDMEPAKYPLGSDKRFPEEIVRIFRAAGFFYGGDFEGRKDPMHFQLCTGY
jgi:hypothetical protein